MTLPVALLTAVATVPNPSTVTVNTTLGPVEGTALAPGECVSFYGVPYAAPPIGVNRFKPPQPATPWVAPRTAFDVPDSCLQTFGDGSCRAKGPLRSTCRPGKQRG